MEKKTYTRKSADGKAPRRTSSRTSGDRAPRSSSRDTAKAIGKAFGKVSGRSAASGESFERRPRKFDGESDERPARRTYRRVEGESEGPTRRTYRRAAEGERDERPARRTYRRSEGESESQARRTYRRAAEGESDERPARRTYRRAAEGERDERPKRTYRRAEGESDERPARRTYRRAAEGERDERPAKRTYRRAEGEGYERPARRTYRKSEDGIREERRFEDRPVRRPRTTSAKATATKAKAEKSGEVRLNKFIANSGICSRREADTYIQTGLVSVNGKIVTELGTRVNPEKDEIRFNNERIRGEKKVYIIMNKPKDYVTTLSDPHAEHTVMELISISKCPERVVPVGRLDKATTGILLFTNDGDLTEKLTHPSHQVKKIYHAHLDKNLTKEDFNKILEGIELEDGPIAADALSYVDDDKAQVGLEIHSGRNRIVRRIFEHLGYKVKKLDRVYFAGLTKKNIRRGEWRFLTEKEVNLLKMGAFE